MTWQTMSMRKISKDTAEKKIVDYSVRHQIWSNHAIEQLSFSINLFITLGVAFLVFLSSKENNFTPIKFNFSFAVDWSLFLSALPLGAVFFSVILGCISTISRLKDLRATRQILHIRKSVVEKHHCLLSDCLREKPPKFFNKLRVFLYAMENIDDSDKIQDIEQKFKTLRGQSKSLGEISRGAHSLQIIFFVIAITLYLLLYVVLSR